MNVNEIFGKILDSIEALEPSVVPSIRFKRDVGFIKSDDKTKDINAREVKVLSNSDLPDRASLSGLSNYRVSRIIEIQISYLVEYTVYTTSDRQGVSSLRESDMYQICKMMQKTNIFSGLTFYITSPVYRGFSFSNNSDRLGLSLYFGISWDE